MAIEQVTPRRLGLARWATAAPDWDVAFAEQLPRVNNFFRYRLGDIPDVEDLTARTFEKAWRAAAGFAVLTLAWAIRSFARRSL